MHVHKKLMNVYKKFLLNNFFCEIQGQAKVICDHRNWNSDCLWEWDSARKGHKEIEH